MSNTLKILDIDFAFIPADKGLNYIICKEFKEVFFDIFEINCGGNKIIAEKVDNLSGDPVLKIATEYNGKLYNTYYVLQEGDNNIILNVKALDSSKKVFDKEKEILESISKKAPITSEETYIVSETTVVDIEKYKADAIRVINENYSKKKHKIEQLQEGITSLIDERISELKSSSITDIDNLKVDILTHFDQKVNQVEIISDKVVTEVNSIRENIEATAELYTNIVTASVDEKAKQLQDLRESVIYDIDVKIAELQAELVNQETQVNGAFKSIQNFIDESKKQLLEQKTNNIADVENIYNESKQAVSVNLKRAESLVVKKIGNLQSTADKKINDITTLVENKISLFDNKIKDINGAIERAEKDLQEHISQALTNILNEAKSHSDILEDKKNELSVLGSNIVESVDKKIKDLNRVAIKREDLNSLKKQLETRLENESANLKKYVAAYSGGGSVAQQFANGGTMNGSLNVATGQILSGGVDISTIFSGGGAADRLVNGSYQVILSSNGDLIFPGGEYIGSQYGAPGWFVTPPATGGIASADGQQYIQINNNQGIFIGTSWPLSAQEWVFGRDGGLTFPDGSVQTTAFINNLSAYATLNYVNNNFLNLSGGNIVGDVTIFGDLSCNGTQTFQNTIFSTTSAISVVHVGSGPALWIGNNGSGDIASFYDIDQNIEVLHVGGNNGSFPNVGVKTSTPNVDFTVNGELSASSIIYDASGNSNQWNNASTTVQSNSASWLQSISFNENTAQLSISNSNTVSLSALSGAAVSPPDPIPLISAIWS